MNRSQERFRRLSGTEAGQQSSLIGEEMRVFHAVKKCGTRTPVTAHRLRLAMAEPPFITGFLHYREKDSRKIQKMEQKLTEAKESALFQGGTEGRAICFYMPSGISTWLQLLSSQNNVVAAPRFLRIVSSIKASASRISLSLSGARLSMNRRARLASCDKKFRFKLIKVYI